MQADRVVVIGASAGGIEALKLVARDLSRDLAASVLVVLHMAPGGGKTLARIIDAAGPLPARVAHDGEALIAGRVYVCVADHHLLVGDGHVHVRNGPRENGHRPAVDPLLRSAAYYYRGAAIGVILSGALSDGTAGLSAIRRLGGVSIVQDPEDALYPGMPASALEYVGADHVVPAAELGALITRVVGETTGRSLPASDDLETEVALMEHLGDTEGDEHAGIPSQWPCPDCNGVLWQIEEDAIVRFRCRVGHAWNGTDLLNIQSQAVEAAVWTALRAVEDRATLSETLADRARESGRSQSADRFTSDSMEYQRSAKILRQLLGTLPSPDVVIPASGE